VFHDRENWGDLEDDASGSWLVQWVEHPTRLLDRPDELPDDYYAEPTAMGVAPVASIPSFVDHRGPNHDRYKRIADHLTAQRRDDPNLFGGEADESWTLTTAWEDDFEPPQGIETSSLGRYGYHERSEDVQDILRAKLPLKPGDNDHVLVFDIAGVDALENWFGDRGHLQVWIRSSDLRARAFDQAWCILRTD